MGGRGGEEGQKVQFLSSGHACLDTVPAGLFTLEKQGHAVLEVLLLAQNGQICWWEYGQSST